MTLRGLGAGATLTRQIIDENHGNAYTAWLQMGSPGSLTPPQRTALEAAGKLTDLGPAEVVPAQDGRGEVTVNLPRQAVMMLTFELPAGQK